MCANVEHLVLGHFERKQGDTKGTHTMLWLASAILHAYENMYPRRRSDPAADPRSAQKYIESLRRTHRVKGITMASMIL